MTVLCSSTLDAIEKAAKAKGDTQTLALVAMARAYLRGTIASQANAGMLAPDNNTAARATSAEVDLARLKAENERLLAAINWALGLGDDFPTRGPGQGAYWWRAELATQAGLTYDKEAYRYVPAHALATEGGDVPPT